MREYTETYTNLYHGTTVQAAENIIKTQSFILSGENSWCGAGIYFYDNKSKALWAAKRKCTEIYKNEKIKAQPTYVNVDIVDLPKSFICDLRTYADLKDFIEKTEELLRKDNIDIVGDFDEEEKTIILRGILISFYVKTNHKKLVIGNFKQRNQPKYVEIYSKADDWQLAFGIETIYCVKDSSILSEIRGVTIA